jgi:hypothetical protein
MEETSGGIGASRKKFQDHKKQKIEILVGAPENKKLEKRV